MATTPNTLGEDTSTLRNAVLDSWVNGLDWFFGVSYVDAYHNLWKLLVTEILVAELEHLTGDTRTTPSTTPILLRPSAPPPPTM